MDSLQSKALVQNACVEIAVSLDIRAVQESQSAKTIIQGNEDEALVRVCSSVLKKADGVVAGRGSSLFGTESVATTMDLCMGTRQK